MIEAPTPDRPWLPGNPVTEGAPAPDFHRLAALGADHASAPAPNAKSDSPHAENPVILGCMAGKRPEWSARTKPTGTIIGTIVVSLRIVREDEDLVGYCDTFDVSSFGATVEEAVANTLEAVEVYLEALDDAGDRDRVFAERGVIFFPGEPPADFEVSAIVRHPGEFVTAERVSIAG